MAVACRLFFWAFLLVFLASPGRAQELANFPRTAVTIDTASGPRRFAVELALSPEQQEQGLMFRRALSPEAGMLFDLGVIRTASFWMHNTLIPLDMLFIDAHGKIADIHERAVPLSDAEIESTVPVRAVLEVNGGTVARLGIHVGDMVHAPIFGNQAGG